MCINSYAFDTENLLSYVVLQMKSASVCVDFIKSSIKKFKLRWIPDKQAMLVLVWNLLLTASMKSYSDYVGYCLKLDLLVFKVQQEMFYSVMGGVFIFLLSGLFSAWLVGWKYRLVDIIFTGMFITGVAFLVGAIPNIIYSGTNKCNRLETVIIMIIYFIILNLGSAPVVTNLFQLAVEQIPDASSSQLASLASWFLFSCVCGSLSSMVFDAVFQCYLTSHSESNQNYLSYYTLVNGVIIAFVLSSFALMKHKLVDNSPTSNTIKHIYQVVKYAIKHRRPVQRSAMTYWEEEIPRGMDLAKRKYGGPFTSEQVEDVKTFFRLSILYLIGFFYLISFYASVFSLEYLGIEMAAKNNAFVFVDFCTTFVMYGVFGRSFLWILISIIVYEVIIKPLLGYKISDVRRKLKFGIFLSFIIFSVIATMVGIIRYSTVNRVNSFWLEVGLSVPIGIASAIISVAGLEFIIAQTPYPMRNFFINVGYNINFFAVTFSRFLFLLIHKKCRSRNCPIIYSLMSLSLNFVAMLLFMIAITRYRMRSRGHEDEHQQRWIEEVYDRYLEQVDT